MKVGVILNPVAGGGRLKRHWLDIGVALKAAFGDFDLRETQAAGDGSTLAMDLAANGCGLVIAAGGDGTLSEVADGLIKGAAEGNRAALGILPCGTGADFARGVGLEGNFATTIRRMAASKGRAIDAGRVSYIDDHGALASRHFINIASLGVSGAVARAVNADERKGRVSAKALFYWRTVAEFIRYRFQTVRITVDNGEPIEASVGLVAAANGRFFGGGMMVAPDAELDDGQFDIVILRAAGKLGLVRDMRLLYGGRHRNHHAITILRGKRVTVEPLGNADLLVEADGESPGRIPATFEILPGAIMLRD
ncbi:diacylglycerol kinase family protein [Mesorhizobium sp. KR9-304]|uniref:diacylglycerol/lipid kinase family protein n=1 Tax=Mesorhizobium sp. KR9-304 TaxID=3156614 RepID=UPI0032B41FEE